MYGSSTTLGSSESSVRDADGRPIFEALISGARVKPAAILYAFDLLELDGRDLRREPIETRRCALERLLGRPPTGLQLVEKSTVILDGEVLMDVIVEKQHVAKNGHKNGSPHEA